ncbi:DUF6049 family protein [Catenulispora subtropica]|uniref:DUF6049 family protein n=1 Tax=Catenulispora subtropica TaxID=450798 RepID=A0ABN2QVD7_9ACTN
MLFLGAGGLLLDSARADDAPAKPSVLVGIDSVLPQIPDFTDTAKQMTFSGRLQNTKSTSVKVVVELRRSLVEARSEMGSATGNGYLVQGKTAPKSQEVAPGATVDWKLTPSEAELFGTKNPRPGVYAIDVDVRDTDGDFLGGQRTYVVWKPLSESGTKKARVALLWPVVGQPGLTGQKTPDNAAAPIVSDPQAAQQFRPGGRLDQILQLGQQFTVNWVLDPDVLYTANQLAGGYFVAADGGAKTPGADAGEAKDWYDAAHDLFSLQAQNCWNLPYADPDLTTLSRTKPGRDLLGDALKLHAPATTGACHRPQTLLWPAGGQADATTLKAVQAANVPGQVTLLASNVVSSWKSAHVSLPQSPDTVAYDTYLSGVFNDEATTPGQPSLNKPGVLAGQQWLAQTALLAADYTDRVLVVAPPRDFTPTAPLASAISATEKLGANDQWVGLDSLDKALEGKPAPAPAPLLAAKTDTPNLPAPVVTSTSDSAKLYRALHSVMDGSHDSDSAVPYRPVATWWRDHDGDTGFSSTVYNTVVKEHGLVAIGGQQQTLTLSGKSGSVPVTIVNNTNSAIHIYLQAHSKQSMQLKVAENQGLQTVARGQSATVRIHVEGEGNGQKIELVATLYTCSDFSSGCTYYPSGLFTELKPEKGHLGPVGQVIIPVKVSRIGIIALGLMIGSGVLLVALIGLRVYRAKRAQHASAQDTMAS